MKLSVELKIKNEELRIRWYDRGSLGSLEDIGDIGDIPLTTKSVHQKKN